MRLIRTVSTVVLATLAAFAGPSTIPRYADSAMEAEAVIVEGILLNDAEREAAQAEWLRRRGYR
jgi:hypothetical protein